MAARVQDWIDGHPVVREALAQGIVNHAALARRIQEELGEPGHDAVLSACHRYDATAPDAEDAVRTALEGGRVDIRTHVGLLAWPATWHVLERLAAYLRATDSPPERAHIFHGWEHVRVVAESDALDAIADAVGEAPAERREGLVELNLRGEASGVPGFLAALTGALASRGVDVVDLASCLHDHVFLIDAGDLAVAVEAVEALRRPS